jgi:hypothetical protein
MNAPNLIVLGLLGLLVVLAVAPVWSMAAGRRGQLAFACTLLATLVAGHWQSLVDNRPWANPDEAQMIAGAITLRHDPVFWRDVDGTTHGPLNQWPLTLASWAGLPLDFRSARLFALVSTTATLLLLIGSLSVGGEIIGRLAVLPAAAWLATVREPEFHQYSSEHMPLVLLAAAVVVGFTVGPSPLPPLRAAAFGALLAALPLAKLQAAPLGAALGALWLWRVARAPGAAWNYIGAALLGSGATLLIVLGPTFVTGAGGEFWSSYIIANRNYCLGENWNPAWPRQVWGLSWLLAITAVFLTAALASNRKALLVLPSFQLGAVLGLAGGFAILYPGYPVLHYWLLLVPAVTLLCGAAVSVTVTRERSSRWLVPTAALACILPFALKLTFQIFPRWESQLTEPSADSTRANALIQQLSLPDDCLAVWGWAPELYVLNQRRQATREAHTYGQIRPGPLQARLRARYLTDLEHANPAVFVDAVHPTAFTFNDRARQAHESFPALASWLDLHYDLAGEFEGLRIYHRRSPPPS